MPKSLLQSQFEALEEPAAEEHAITIWVGKPPTVLVDEIIAGVAEYTTDLAIASARRMQAAGAAGIMALPTMVYQQDAREGEHHFRTLARNIDLPIMIYNNRPAYKLDLLPESFAALADEKNIVGSARAVHDLAERARTNRLSADEVHGGTFTLNNPGTLGSLFSTPIIVQPQSAILSMEAIVKRAAVIDDAIAIRPMMNLSLSIDHRLLDGLAATRFLAAVKRGLEAFPVDEGT